MATPKQRGFMANESAVQNTNHTITCYRPMRMRLFVVGTCCLAIGALVGWNARAQARLPAHEHSHRSAPLHDTAGVVVVEADRSSILWPLGRVRDGSAQDAHHLRHVTTENHQGEAAHGLRPGKPADQAHSQVHSSSNNTLCSSMTAASEKHVPATPTACRAAQSWP